MTEATDDLLRFPERAVDLLLNEILETIEQPFILVLDDYHHIGRETIVHKLVDRLLQYSSDMLHLIITTRDLPPLAIMRRRTQSAALVITREDLLFTDEEVRELFRQTLNVELKDEEIAEYRERTHGWITALQLVRQVAEQEIHAHSERRTLDLQRNSATIGKRYFRLFRRRSFLARTGRNAKSSASSVSARIAAARCLQPLFPDMRCSAILPELVQKNVFLTVAGDGQTSEEYRLHPLFRDFLQRRLRSEIGRAELAHERNRHRRIFSCAKIIGKKLCRILLEAENFERAAQIIAEKGGEWIAGGAITTLGIFAEKIPLEFLDKFPRALLHKAEIARLQGETEKSSNLLNRAVKLLARRK